MQDATQVAAATLQRSGPVMAYVLSHEQFPAPHLVEYGAAAEHASFDMIWTSDHFQPWQPNEGHSGLAWVTLAALSQRTTRLGFGTGVTCPVFRYRPAVIAEAWASLSLLAPGRPFLGLGAGEKLNEAAAGGGWGLYRERAARLIEAVEIIRRLWTGRQVIFNGTYWNVNARLYDPPAAPIPIYIAASGPKSARLSGIHGDGLIADPNALATNPEYKAAWEEGARSVGKDPATMPILLENFIVIGGEAEAKYSAEKWRFVAKAWRPGYFNNISPADIQHRAEREIPLESVYGNWPVSTDPQVHVRAIQRWVDLGATHIFTHTATDQLAAIEFYSKQVLPLVRGGGVTGVRPVVGVSG